MSNLNKFSIQKSFAISAGAGSGKTYTLSRRYINALLGFDYFREDYSVQQSFFDELKASKVSQIVTITYTEAAALEMKSRIFDLINKILNFENLKTTNDDYDSIFAANNCLETDQLEYVLTTLETAKRDIGVSKISTIHSFCLDILKSNSDIAKIDTKLEILADKDKKYILSKIIFENLNNESNKKTLHTVLDYIPINFLNQIIESYTFNSTFRNSFLRFDNKISSKTFKELIYELYSLPEEYNVLAELQRSPKHRDRFDKYREGFVNFEAKTWGGAPTTLGKSYPLLSEMKSAVEKNLSTFSNIDDSKEEEFYKIIEIIKSLLLEIKTGYDLKLKELGKTDFDTIISETSRVIDKCNTNFKYIMVDEFQDTNELQFSIIRSCSSSSNLFVVGDSKQSIYGFQGAQLEVFKSAINDKSLFYSVEDISKNFRSDGVVLKTINTIFRRILKGSKNYEAEPMDLDVGKTIREKDGSFKFLITSQDHGEKDDELDTLVSFICDIVYKNTNDYSNISNLVDKGEKAIAILFDAKAKMIELKKKLKAVGINAKISKSDGFYKTKEINDIFNLLKAIDILSYKQDNLSEKDRYYITGALRSNYLRVTDREIKSYLDSNSVPLILEEFVDYYTKGTLSSLVKYIYEYSNIFGVYAHLPDVEQRYANLNKFLRMVLEFELEDDNNLLSFLNEVESSIYFSESKESEEFYISSNEKSIELCTIHGTKGLAYPMVILADSNKTLTTSLNQEKFKFDNYFVDNNSTEIIGFKIGDYSPLALRAVKKVNELKHIAEKKRLLYVALTRAEHDVVISGKIQMNKEAIKVNDNSYLSMITDGLLIDQQDLFDQDSSYCIKLSGKEVLVNRVETIEYIDHSFKQLTFTNREDVSATMNSVDINIEAAYLGTITHKIIEQNWSSFTQDEEKVFRKFSINSPEIKNKIKSSMENFYDSNVFTYLNNGAEYRFELEFNNDGKSGYIDLIYYDNSLDGWVIIDFKTGEPSREKEHKYSIQLDFYEKVLVDLGFKVSHKEILWL